MSRSRSARSGLTLLELVIVLVILAALTGVAVQSLEPVADQVRYEQTQTTFERARDAIVESRLQGSGVVQTAGFVADIGRLPESLDMLVDSTGVTSFTTVSPAVDLASFPMQSRLGPDASDTNNPTNIDCTGVSLRCGWRGPYLTVADPTTGIVDGWGQPFTYGEFPAGGDVHIVWTAITSNYTDQVVDVESSALQTVAGAIQDTNGALRPDITEVALVYPDPTVSTTTLAVMQDTDIRVDHFEFQQVPVGVRAIVFTDGTNRAIRYIDVSPMHVQPPIRITEF